VIAIAIFHGLGDCVNATNILGPLKQKYPKREIVWITSEKYAPLVRNNPHISKVVAVPGDVWAADKKYPELRKQYKKIIIPAPYLNPRPSDGTLLGSFKDRVSEISKVPAKKVNLRPLLFLTDNEKERAKEWLGEKGVKKFIMMETAFSSSQTFWDPSYTKLALKILAEKGYTVVLAQRNDALLEKYNKICPTVCMDLGFRMAPAIYNHAKGFIGVSSGISCLVHTHQARKDIPHLEFVRGWHWSTKHYPKDKKKHSFNEDPNHVRKLIQDAF
jgi:ADP-heptose:LPS heptosyltransferase